METPEPDRARPPPPPTTSGPAGASGPPRQRRRFPCAPLTNAAADLAGNESATHAAAAGDLPSNEPVARVAADHLSHARPAAHASADVPPNAPAEHRRCRYPIERAGRGRRRCRFPVERARPRPRPARPSIYRRRPRPLSPAAPASSPPAAFAPSASPAVRADASARTETGWPPRLVWRALVVRDRIARCGDLAGRRASVSPAARFGRRRRRSRRVASRPVAIPGGAGDGVLALPPGAELFRVDTSRNSFGELWRDTLADGAGRVGVEVAAGRGCRGR